MDSPFDPGTQGNQDLPVWTRREGISGLKPHCVPAPGPGSSLVSAFDLNKDGRIRVCEVVIREGGGATHSTNYRQG